MALKLGEIRLADPVDAGFDVLKLGADRVIGLCEVQEGLVLAFQFQNPADIAGELSDKISRYRGVPLIGLAPNTIAVLPGTMMGEVSPAHSGFYLNRGVQAFSIAKISSFSARRCLRSSVWCSSLAGSISVSMR